MRSKNITNPTEKLHYNSERGFLIFILFLKSTKFVMEQNFIFHSLEIEIWFRNGNSMSGIFQRLMIKY